jgi:hypothetical protein
VGTRLLLVMLATGCDGVWGLNHVYSSADAPPDAPCPNGPVAAGQAGSLMTICALPALQPSFPSAAMTDIDTDLCASPASVMAQGGADSPEVCVVAAEVLSIGTSQLVRAHGQRPLVLLSGGGIDVAGTVDVATRKGSLIGAGSDWVGCPSPRDRDGSGTGASGAGGSFGGLGGAGGKSTNGGAGTSGVPDPVVMASQLRGGCPGGNGNDAPTSGVHGSSGGAVYLIATGTITISGVINASGRGGQGGDGSRGGGGGGSGGMIALDAPSIVVASSARIFANGGGGGGGGGSSAASPGGDGADPMMANVAAAGGPPGSPGGAQGGNGSAGAMVDGMAGTGGPQGAGAGGGGAGYVHLIGPSKTLDGIISPPPG